MTVSPPATFQAFPAALRPTDRAFVFGGKGATSSLHVDAYNWTGWNAGFIVRRHHNASLSL
jgi:hypothetical protein